MIDAGSSQPRAALFLLARLISQDLPMLFCAKANTATIRTADTGKIRMGGSFRLPVMPA
jgi:hypothetical protein